MAYLAPGEEVISNQFGQADRNRDLLKAVNANRLAIGGTVTRDMFTLAAGGTVSTLGPCAVPAALAGVAA